MSFSCLRMILLSTKYSYPQSIINDKSSMKQYCSVLQLFAHYASSVTNGAFQYQNFIHENGLTNCVPYSKENANFRNFARITGILAICIYSNRKTVLNSTRVVH